MDPTEEERRFDEQVSLYLECALDERAAAELDQALAASPEKARRFWELAKTHAGLWELKRIAQKMPSAENLIAPPDTVTKGSSSRRIRSLRRRQPSSWEQTRWPAMLAASAALAVLLWLIFSRNSTPSPTAQQDLKNREAAEKTQVPQEELKRGEEVARQAREKAARAEAELKKAQERIAELERQRKEKETQASQSTLPPNIAENQKQEEENARLQAEVERKRSEEELRQAEDARKRAEEDLARLKAPVQPPAALIGAKLEKIEGEAVVLDSEQRKPASAGMALVAGQGLETAGEQSSVTVRYEDGTQVVLTAKTTVREFLAGPGKWVVLSSGVLTAEVAKQPAGQAMVFRTPVAEAQVLGTALKLSASGAATQLDVTEGRVRLTRTKDKKFVEIPAGQYAVVAEGETFAAKTIASRMAAGLVAHWKLDETVGAIANDASGNNLRGTLAGNPAWTPGKIGGALSFDGGKDGVNLGNPPSLNFASGSFTCSLWVCLTQYTEKYHMPFSKGGWSSNNAGFDVSLSPDNWGADVADGTTGMRGGFTIGALNQWTFLTIVVDRGADQLRTYTNGGLTQSVSIKGLGSLSSSLPAIIGGTPMVGQHLKGKVDDVRLYNRALNAAEIRDLHASGSQAK